MGEVIGVDALYKCFDIISSDSTEEPKKVEAFTAILGGTKGGIRKKDCLLKEESFNCLLDLCDDPDVAIRKQAVQDLQSICKHEPAFTSRVADVLVQMLATDDHSESHIVTLALSGLLLADPKSTLTGIFNQMLADNSGSPRDHVLKFLAESLKRLPKETLDDQLEEFILEQTNKVLLDVSEDEFILLITVLSSLKCMSTVPGRQKLVNMITTQVVQAVPSFDPQDASCLAQVRESGRQAVRFLSKNVTAGAFLRYTLQKVIPFFEPIGSELDRRGILRVLTEFSMHPGDAFLSCSEAERAQILCPLHSLLLSSLPTVPEDPLLALSSAVETDSGSGKSQSTKNLIPDEVSNLNLLEIECLLFSIVNLAKLLPSFLDFTDLSSGDSASNSEAISRVRCVRPKLQYLARLLQLYRRNILSATEELLKLEEIAQESAAHEAKQALSNVEVLVRLFFRNRPNLDISAMMPSWKKMPVTVKPGEKRPPIPLADQSMDTVKTGRTERTFYRMPVGRWSGGRSGARGGFRGRRFSDNSLPGRGRMY